MTDDLERNVAPSDSVDAGTENGAGARLPDALTPEFSLAFLRTCAEGAFLLTPAGRITFLNASAVALLGLPNGERATGVDFWELWPNGLAPALQSLVEQAAEGEAVSVPVLRDTDGRSFVVTASPVIDANGRTESVFVVTAERTG